jgi:hypothetical protein
MHTENVFSEIPKCNPYLNKCGFNDSLVGEQTVRTIKATEWSEESLSIPEIRHIEKILGKEPLLV